MTDEPVVIEGYARPEQFLIIAKRDDDEEEYMDIVNESDLGTLVDGADYLPVSVQSVFVLRKGALVKCEFGDVERIEYPNPENPQSIIYAYSPLYAGDEKVAMLALTDH